MDAAGRKSLRRWLIRLAGSVVMLAVVFWLVPLDAFLDALRRVSWTGFGLVLAGFLLAHVAAGAKWWVLMGRRVPLGLALRAHFAGLAANLCLPGAIGGDAVRATLAHLSLRDGARVTAAAAADRLIDTAALGTLMLCGLILARPTGSTAGDPGGTGAAPLWAIAFLLAMAVTVMFLPRLLPLPWRLAPKLPGHALATRLAEAFSDLGRRPGLLIGGFAASLTIQGSLVLLSWVLARQIGVDPGLAAWAFAWPLAKILAVAPISLNGLGLREGTLAALLVPFGAPAAAVVAAGLLWQAVLFAAGAIGGIIYLLTPGTGERVPG